MRRQADELRRIAREVEAAGSTRYRERLMKKWDMTLEEVNTELDYIIADTLGTTLDEVDQMPLAEHEKRREEFAKDEL